MTMRKVGDADVAAFVELINDIVLAVDDPEPPARVEAARPTFALPVRSPTPAPLTPEMEARATRARMAERARGLEIFALGRELEVPAGVVEGALAGDDTLDQARERFRKWELFRYDGSRARWDADSALREEFSGDLAAFEAYARALREGRITPWRPRR
jgi:hypothetical protein